MAPKATKSVSLEWLDKNIWSKLSDSLTDQDAKVLKDAKALLNKLKQSPTSLPARGLELGDVRQMFGLIYGPHDIAWSLDKHERYEIPPLLKSIIAEHMFVTQIPVINEALARATINEILIICIAEEKRLSIGHSQSNLMPPAQAHSHPRTPEPEADPAPLFLKFETKLSFEVTFNKEQRLLQGIADYSLWYDKDEPMGTNLLLVEAKRPSELSSANGQLVAYMGIVHRTREINKNRNKVVYGISTDGDAFRFWRVDNSSQLSCSRLYELQFNDGSEIISYIRLIVRAAIHSSPTTTPIKDKARREVSLGTFSDINRTKIFDYGIGGLTIDDDGDVEFNDVEILDLPDIP